MSLEQTQPMGGSTLVSRLEPFDALATMVAVASPHGDCLYANTTLEDRIGASRRTLMRGRLDQWLSEAEALRRTLARVAGNEVSSARFEARLAPIGLAHAPLPVHVIVSQLDRLLPDFGPDPGPGLLPEHSVLVEMIEIQQQERSDREERTLELAKANKELVRNLAHEIKNPLGGIRGAAQLLEMDLASPELIEFTQVIIREADRLQRLVDRLLDPHRQAHRVGDVNIHEVLENVRSLILAEFPKGLAVERDYDTSLPEFRGDREHLVQAVLNVVRNAAEALAPQIGAADGPAADAAPARIVMRSRIARQVTINRQRCRLALELHIEDNGPGVPEAIRERIFHPLVSGRDGGSGLGLTLAQSFIEQHQGTIECDSASGRTVFTILIPLP